jgi:signal transduction histidine kinase
MLRLWCSMLYGCVFMLNSVALSGQSDAATLRALADRVTYLNESYADSFLIYANIIEEQSKKINYQRGICDSYRLRGIYHEYRNEHDQSIVWYLKNLALSERIGDAESQLSALSDLAALYHVLQQFEEARNYQLRAIKLGEQVQTKPKRLSIFYMNLGVFYRASGQLDSALWYYDKSLAIKRQIGDSTGIYNVMVNMGALLLVKKKYTDAQPYVQACMDYHQRHRDTVNLWFDFFQQSQIDLANHDPALAERRLKTALQLAESIPSTRKISDTYQQFAILYEAQGKYPLALDMMRRYQEMNATTINVEKNRAVAELREKYEADRREHQNQLLSLDNKRQKSQKLSLGIIALLMALLAAMAGFAWWGNHQKRRLLTQKNEELQDEKQKLENTLLRLHEMRDQLMQSEKMASIGQLTAGIAHEINNPVNFIGVGIQAIKMNLSDLRQVFQADGLQQQGVADLFAEIETLMAGIERGMDRTRDIVLGLRSFARNDEIELTPVNLHDCLDTTLAIIAHETKNTCEVVKIYGEIPMVPGLAGKLNQLFLNLLTNAVQAIQARHKSSLQPLSGRIEIETRMLNDRVQVTIRDNGIGMDETTRKRIFEPFFTTKPVGLGTGLGMAISYGIVQQHQGDIQVESDLGKGTTIRVTFG